MLFVSSGIGEDPSVLWLRIISSLSNQIASSGHICSRTKAQFMVYIKHQLIEDSSYRESLLHAESPSGVVYVAPGDCIDCQ